VYYVSGDMSELNSVLTIVELCKKKEPHPLSKIIFIFGYFYDILVHTAA
jgi:hypothetical protein